MKKIHTLSIFVALVFAISFSVHQVYADGSVTLTPQINAVKIDGTGFFAEAGHNLNIFVDGIRKDTVVVTVSDSGSFTITIPLLPGHHKIDITDTPDTTLTENNALFSGSVDVPGPSIPEFPIPFSLVIIFVAVAAVYMGIRQKMTTNFKR